MKAFVLAILLAQEPALVFRSPSGAFELWDFDTVAWEAPREAGHPPTMHAEVRGKAFRLRWRDRGIDVSGRTGTVDADRTAAGNFFITRAGLAGGVSIHRDTRLADEFAAEQAKAAGSPSPEANPNHSSLTLTTEALSYAGDADGGTVTMGAAFDLDSRSHRATSASVKGSPNQRAPLTIDDQLTLRGADGTVTFATDARDVNALRTGHVSMPVVHLVRKAVQDGKALPDSIVDASADRMDLDFLSANRTLTLTGNVVVNGSAEVYAGTTKASKAIITFGPDGRITRIEMTGSPTETNVKPRPAAGGGGN